MSVPTMFYVALVLAFGFRVYKDGDWLPDGYVKPLLAVLVFLLMSAGSAFVLMKPDPIAFNSVQVSTGPITFVDYGKGHWSKLSDLHVSKSAGIFGSYDVFGSVDGVKNFETVTASLVPIRTLLGSVDVALEVTHDGKVLFVQTPGEVLAKWRSQSIEDLLWCVVFAAALAYGILVKLKA